MDSNTVTALATAILAIITIWYAISTHRLLEETQVARKVAFIEKRLEKLYYPLRDIVRNPVTQVYVGDDKGYFIDLKKIDNIIPFQYLASKELGLYLDEFIKKAFENRYITDTGYDHVSYEIVDDKVKIKVDEDIDNLKNELKKLVKSSD